MSNLEGGEEVPGNTTQEKESSETNETNGSTSNSKKPRLDECISLDDGTEKSDRSEGTSESSDVIMVDSPPVAEKIDEFDDDGPPDLERGMPMVMKFLDSLTLSKEDMASIPKQTQVFMKMSNYEFDSATFKGYGKIDKEAFVLADTLIRMSKLKEMDRYLNSLDEQPRPSISDEMLAHLSFVLARVKMQSITKNEFNSTSIVMSDLDSNSLPNRLLEILKNDADTIPLCLNVNRSTKPQWDDSQEFFNRMLYNRFCNGEDVLVHLAYFLGAHDRGLVDTKDSFTIVVKSSIHSFAIHDVIVHWKILGFTGMKSTTGLVWRIPG
uniref:Uncharacterized protein n=1 Tax=Caenorhabditis tropicalis TaxID=1561998 RepID=A0A1I7TN49_9PELO